MYCRCSVPGIRVEKKVIKLEKKRSYNGVWNSINIGGLVLYFGEWRLLDLEIVKTTQHFHKPVMISFIFCRAVELCNSLPSYYWCYRICEKQHSSSRWKGCMPPAFFCYDLKLPVFLWRSHIPKLKIAFPSEVLVSSDYRPYRKNLAFYNVLAWQGSSFWISKLCVAWRG